MNFRKTLVITTLTLSILAVLTVTSTGVAATRTIQNARAEAYRTPEATLCAGGQEDIVFEGYNLMSIQKPPPRYNHIEGVIYVCLNREPIAADMVGTLQYRHCWMPRPGTLECKWFDESEQDWTEENLPLPGIVASLHPYMIGVCPGRPGHRATVEARIELIVQGISHDGIVFGPNYYYFPGPGPKEEGKILHCTR